MNIFKGVAGLLRKGSSGAFTDLIAGEAHGPGVGSPSFIDIQFRKEGEEELLDDLWQEYQGASKEKSAKSFDAFLREFIRTYEDWTPLDTPGEIAGGGASSGGEDLRTPAVGCETGHPTRVVVGFVQELKNVTRIVTDAAGSAEEPQPLKAQTTEAGLNLLHALTIATRSAHNRKVFAFFDGFQALMRLMKTAVVRLKSLANTVSPDARPSLATYTQLTFLQCLLAHIVSVAANYVDAHMRAIQRSASQAQLPSGDEGFGFGESTVLREGYFFEGGSRDGSRPTSPKGERAKGGVEAVPLLESGGLNHFVDLLSLLRELRAKRTLSDNSLEQLALRTLRSAFTGSPRVQNHFRSIGGLDLLVQNLGWPALDEDDLTNPEGLESLEQLGDALTLEYRMQLLTLRVLREAVHRNLASLQRVHEIGGFKRLTDMLRWVARTFPEVSSPQTGGQNASGNAEKASSRTGEDKGKVAWTSKGGALASKVSSEDLSALPTEVLAWNREVAEVCKVLCSLLTSPDGTLGPAVSSAGDPATGQAYWDFALRRLVDVFLGAFEEKETDGEQDHEALELFKKDSTTLQHYVLHIFRRILTVTPSTLDVFRESGTWEVLLSESFFYWGAHSADKSLEHVAEVASEAQGGSPSPRGSKPSPQPAEHEAASGGSVEESVSPRAWGEERRRLSFSPRTGVQFEETERLSGPSGSQPVASTSGREGPDLDSGRRTFRAGKEAATAPSRVQNETNNKTPGSEHVGFTFTSSGYLRSKQPDSPEGEALRLEVLSFIETAATLETTESNAPECAALLSTLRLCAGLPGVAAPLARCLDRVLQLAPDRTVNAFVNQKAEALLADIMEAQRDIQNAAVVRAKGAPKSARTVRRGAAPPSLPEGGGALAGLVVETWWQARSAVFSLFGSFLAASAESRSAAVHEGRVVSVLFGLLFEERARASALKFITLLMKVPPRSEEDRAAKAAVFVRYLETLPRARADIFEGGSSEGLLHDLLMGIREVVSADPPYYQNLFLEGECFVQIVSLLGGDHPAGVGESLCLEVLATLTKLLAGNDACKAGFRDLVGAGYPTLQKVLVERHAEGLTRGLLAALLDMLMDGGFDADADDVIRNEDVVPLFIGVLREASSGLQCEGLDSFQKLLQGNVANAACCVRAGLVSLVLDWFPSIASSRTRVRALSLVQLCGAHSVSGKNMCTFFGLLRSDQNGARPKHSALLLQTLQRMAQKEGPAVFFVLNGQDSGLLINSPVRFPSSRGYTFTAWLRVECFPPESAPMGLFQFRTTDGRGCGAYLHQQGVIVHVASGGKSQTVALGYPFRLRRWHFVAITHNTTRALSGSHAKLVVDGQVAMSEKLRYPKISEPLNRCSIAAACPLPPASDDEPAHFHTDTNLSSPFCGQLGPVYLFDDALSTSQAAAIHQLGPNYMFSFQNQEVGCVPDGARREIVDLMDGRDGLAPRVVLAYNAQASLGRTVYNNAPFAEQSAELAYDAAILGGTQLCVTRKMQDVIHCVGGIPSLLPLFTQLDQPVASSPDLDSEPTSPVSPSNSTTSPEALSSLQNETSKSLDFAVDHSMAVEVIGALSAMLTSHPANQEDMHANQGFAVVGHQLERVSPQHLTVEFVLTLEKLLTNIQEAPGPVSDALLEDCLIKVYLNFRLWIYTPFIVQRELLIALARHVDKQPARLRNHCGLAQTLEILREFYWDKPTSSGAAGARPLYHPVTHDVIGQRPASQEVSQLRGLLLGIADRVMSDVGPSLADVRALVCFLEKSRDAAVLEDVLKTVVTRAQKSRPFLTSFGEHVAALGGPQLFLGLLAREQEPLRLLGLRLIGLLLAAGVGCNGREKKERKGARDAVAAVVANIAGGNSSIAQAVQGVDKDTAENNSAVLTAVAESLLPTAFTEALRAALFEVLLGGVPAKPKSSPRKASIVSGGSKSFHERMSPGYVTGLFASLGGKTASQGDPPEDDVIGGGPAAAPPSTRIAIPPVAEILLKFVLKCEDFAVRKDVLRELNRLAEASPANRDALLSLPDWQERLFDLMADEFAKANGEGAAAALKETAHEEEIMVRTLFRTLHVHCCVQVKAGWRHLERTVNFLHAFSEREALPGFYILHDLLSDLVGLLLEIPPTQSALNQQPLRDCVAYIFSLTDELVMGDLLKISPAPPSWDRRQSDDPPSSDIALLSGDYIDVGLGSLLSPTKMGGENTAPKSPTSAEFPATPSSSASSPRVTSKRTSFGAATAETPSRRGSYDVATPDSATPARRKWLRGAFANGKMVMRTPSCWALYDQIWRLLEAIHGIRKGPSAGGNEARLLPAPQSPTSGSSSGSSRVAALREKAKGFVDSLEQKAAELTSGQPQFAAGVQTKLSSAMLDRVVKGRGERCPRIVYRLVLLYLKECDLEGASRCMQQFLALLPGLLGPAGGGQNEATANRLQHFLWSLLDVRASVGQMDNGARFYVVSQLLRETVEQGKGALASNLNDQSWLSVRTSVVESGESASTIHRLLQQDRVIAAVKDESSYVAAISAQRSREIYALQSELSEAASAETRCRTQMEEARQLAVTSAVTSDASRRAVAQLAADEERAAVARHWTHMYRELTEARGPWAAEPGGGEAGAKWKMDRTEDRSRRRLKLKRNYDFDESLQQPTQQKTDRTSESEAPAGGASLPILKGLRGLVAQAWGKEGDDLAEDDPPESASAESDLPGGEEPGAIDPHAAAEEFERNDSMRRRRESGAKAGASGNDADVDQEVLMSAPCVLVRAQGKVAGRLELTKTAAHFYGEYEVEGSGGTSVFEGLEKGKTGGKDRILESLLSVKPRGGEGKNGEPDRVKKHRVWVLKEVKEVHLMRYLLRHSALELFFYTAQRPVFFNFPSNKVAKDVAQALCSLSPLIDARAAGLGISGTALIDKRRSLELVERARDAWRRRELSNFDYLMALNTLAGRTYNDLTQYPVFPWVLSDYASEKLDLSDTSKYRDLSKPVGALDPKRLETFEERFRAFSDPDIPSFHYGSHYSTAGVVLFYLLRLEPFTGLHRSLQGGKFDHADRLFHSMESAWTNCLTNTSDVKELVPEFFYLPEFLENANGYWLGVKQDGARLGDVVLPPWAKGSASEFVRLHREALESEYVSEHLHEWVDLIFGYKQRGKFAVEAANVFYYLTYENAVDLDAIEDAVERASVEDQIANFGQTPVQLFRKPHPKRGPPIPVARPLYYAPASITLTSAVPAVPSPPGHAAPMMPHPAALAFTGVVDNKVVTISRSQVMVCRAWITPHTLQAGSFSFSSMQDPFFGVSSEPHCQRRVGAPFSPGLDVSPLLFSALRIGDRTLLVTAGHWDNTFKLFSADDGRLVQSVLRHKDAVTCVGVSPETGGSPGVIVAGSRDTTVTVWETVTVLEKGYSGRAVADRPSRVLCGHDDVINCVAVSRDLDVVASGSKDASVILHTLRNGRYLRSFAHPSKGSVDRLVLSRNGMVLLYSHDDLMLHVVSLNGAWLAHAEANGRLSCIAVSTSGDFIVTGGERGSIVVRWVHDLQVVRRYEGTGVPITSLHVTPEDCFLVGLQDGSLLIFSVEAQQLKKGAAFFSMVADV